MTHKLEKHKSVTCFTLRSHFSEKRSQGDHSVTSGEI